MKLVAWVLPIIILCPMACSSLTGTSCSSITVETEHRVSGDVVLESPEGTIASGPFDSNRTNDQAKPDGMHFEETGAFLIGWEYHPTDGSKSLGLKFIRNRPQGPQQRNPDDPLERIDGTILDIEEVPGVGTFPLDDSLYCYCPDERRYPTRDGCSAEDPGYISSVYRYSDGVVCEPVVGTLEVRMRDIHCDHPSAILPATCSGDLDVTITIPPRADRRFSARLRVVEHSTHSIVYCHGPAGS